MYFIVNDVSNVNIGTKFIYKGLEIGVVENESLHNNKILVKARFKKEFKLAKNHKFTIKTIDMLGNSCIVIEESENVTEYYNFGDTVITNFKMPESISLDSLKTLIEPLKEMILEN